MIEQLRQMSIRPEIRLRLWGDLALFALLAMESFWITDWYDALAQPKASWIGVDLFVGGLLILSHVLARGCAHLNLPQRSRRAIFGGWMLLAALVSFPVILFNGEGLTLLEMGERVVTSFTRLDSNLGEFWNLLFLIFVVYRGIQLAREPLLVDMTQASFQLGMFLLLLYGLIYSWDKPGQALLTTYGFLFMAVAAMSATRISTLSEMRGGRLPPLQSPWLLGILAIAGLVVGIAVTLGWFATNIAADVVAIVYTIIAAIAIIIGLIVLSPLILLILSMGTPLRNLIDAIFQFGALGSVRKFISDMAEKIGVTPEWITNVARTWQPTLLIGILLGALALVWIAVVWKPWQRRWVREETASTLPLRAALRFPKLLLGRLSGKLSSGGRMLAAARIRWVYAQLMELCTRLGKPRRPSITPLEYLPTAQTLFPGEDITLNTITQAYLKVRYGELPETYEEVQGVLLAWEKLKAQGKQTLLMRKKNK